MASRSVSVMNVTDARWTILGRATTPAHKETSLSWCWLVRFMMMIRVWNRIWFGVATRCRLDGISWRTRERSLAARHGTPPVGACQSRLKDSLRRSDQTKGSLWAKVTRKTLSNCGRGLGRMDNVIATEVVHVFFFRVNKSRRID